MWLWSGFLSDFRQTRFSTLLQTTPNVLDRFVFGTIRSEKYQLRWRKTYIFVRHNWFPVGVCDDDTDGRFLRFGVLTSYERHVRGTTRKSLGMFLFWVCGTCVKIKCAHRTYGPNNNTWSATGRTQTTATVWERKKTTKRANSI